MDDDDIEIPQASPHTAVDPAHFEQMQELLEQLVTRVVALENHVADLSKGREKRGAGPALEDSEVAPWVLYPPPALTGDSHADVRSFVEYYNTVYIGRSGGRAQRIPACWEEHPGLAMEIANFAVTWRAANAGPLANPRDAQLWHHQWRTGTIERMIRDWLHPDCLDGSHQGRAGNETTRPEVKTRSRIE